MIGLPIGDEAAADRTRSDLEQDFLRSVAATGCHGPRSTFRIGPYLVDFLWREERFVVETDSYLYHRGESPSRTTTVSDLDLRRLGFDVLRLSERQIDEEAERVAEALVAALTGRRGEQQ